MPARFDQTTEALFLDEVRSQGRCFLLTHPLQIESTSSQEGWCYEFKPLAILAFGKSRQEALDSFTEDFGVLWGAIAQAPDASLTADAIAVKQAFERLVETVTTE